MTYQENVELTSTQLQAKKVLEAAGYQYPLNVAMMSAWIAGNYKAFDLKIIDVSAQSTLADYFVLFSTLNSVQSEAISHEIRKCARLFGIKLISEEGRRNSDWNLLDLGDVIIHVFSQSAREVYDLDTLWANYPIVEIPSDYYVPDSKIAESFVQDPGEGYF